MSTPKPCPWCARPASECWVMPCLELQSAIDGEDDASMRFWAKSVGVGLTKHGSVFVAPPVTAEESKGDRA